MTQTAEGVTLSNALLEQAAEQPVDLIVDAPDGTKLVVEIKRHDPWIARFPADHAFSGDELLAYLR